MAAVLAGLMAVGCGGGVDEPPDRPFAAQRVMAGADGAVVAVGVDGGCGRLRVMVARGRRVEQTAALGPRELGFKCVQRVVGMSSGPRGIDVTVEGTDDDGSLFEDTQRSEWDVLRLTRAGRRSEAFGGDGLARDVPSESMAPAPGGGLLSPGGRIVDAEGKQEDSDDDPFNRRGRLPVDLVPGSEEIVPATGGGFLVAGEPRAVEQRTAMWVVRLRARARLERGWGRDGVARVPRLGQPGDVFALADGGAWVLDLFGGAARLDGRGKVAVEPVLPFGTPTQGPRAPSGDVDQSAAADPGGTLTVARSIGDGRVGVLRARADGRVDRSFRAPALDVPGGGRRVSAVSVAARPGGGALVLIDPRGPSAPSVVKLDRRGKRDGIVTLR